MWFQSHFKQIPSYTWHSSAAPPFNATICGTAFSRTTSKQLHQLNAWESKVWLRGKKQWLEKNLHIIYNSGENSVWNFLRWAQNLEILYPEDGLVWMLPLHLRKRVMNDLMERGNQLAFYNERKLFICSLKKASSPALSANTYTSRCCITQAFYCYSLHVNISLSQHKLAAVNTANTNYQEMICLRRKCCKLSSPHNVLKHP